MKRNKSISSMPEGTRGPAETKPNELNPMEKRQSPNEGEIRKVQRGAGKDAYNEDYEVGQENERDRKEAQREKAHRKNVRKGK